MRILLPLLLAGCAEAMVVGWISDSTSETVQLRSQVKAHRMAAGLDDAAFWEEIRLLNSTWWYSEQRAVERRTWNLRPNDVEPASRVRGQPWPELWPERHLYTRAVMLETGASERDILARVAADDPHWYERWVRHTAAWPELRMGVTEAELPPRPKRPTARYE